MWIARLWTLFKTAGRGGLLLLFALRDAETPRLIKFGIAALALYVISPIDILPDVALFFGWADDLALMMVGIPFLTRRLPAGVLNRASGKVERMLSRWGIRSA